MLNLAVTAVLSSGPALGMFLIHFAIQTLPDLDGLKLKRTFQEEVRIKG